MRPRRPLPYREVAGGTAAERPDTEEIPMPSPTTTDTPDRTAILDQTAADQLSAEFNRCFSHFEARTELFSPDTFFDLLPPLWRFQFEGPGEAFTAQLRSIAAGPVDIEVVRTIPTSTGFVTEHVETHHAPDGDLVARRIHVCEVTDGRISAVTTYCNGGWDAELRARHATEAPLIRP
jgi:ketosteroid isomerase-like protein